MEGRAAESVHWSMSWPAVMREKNDRGGGKCHLVDVRVLLRKLAIEKMMKIALSS